MATHYSSPYRPLSHTNTNIAAVFLCFLWLATVGDEGWSGLLPPDSLWRWCFCQPHAGRPFLWTKKSTSHIKSPSVQLLSDFRLVLCVTLSNFVLLVLVQMYLSNKSWSQRSKVHILLAPFWSVCVLLLVSQQALCAPGQDPSPDQSGSSTKPVLWSWGGCYHSCG